MRIPRVIRCRLEKAFDADLSRVVVRESLLPVALGAEAVAHGEQIDFAPGRFRPGDAEGLVVLAHEVAHVLQQRFGMVRGGPEDPRRSGLEAQAWELGHLAARGRRANFARGVRRAGPTPGIQCVKTEFAGMSALELLAILDEQVQFFTKKYSNKIHPQKARTYRLQEGWCWLAASGHLAITKSTWSTKNSWVPCKLVVGHDGTEMEVSGRDAFSERLEFPSEKGEKKDLNYMQIASQIRGLGMNEATQAKGLLYRMRGWMGLGTPQQGVFLDAMVALLFGLEASRNRATYATTLMLLDLVRHGKMYGSRGNKPFTLSGAFNSSHGYNWDDGEFAGRTPELWEGFDGTDSTQPVSGHLYGGKHPMAVHGTGEGNLKARYAMTSDPSNATHGQEFKTLNQKHAVPRREASLLIHWLESNVHPSGSSVVNNEWVKSRIKARLAVGYERPNPLWDLPNSPRTDTGTKTRLTFGGSIYFVGRNGKVIGKHYHADPRCKLIPGQAGINVLESKNWPDIAKQ